KDVRLMIGTCVDELQLSWKPITGRSPLRDVEEKLGEHGPRVVEGYAATASGGSDADVAKLLTSDWKFRIPSIRFAEAQLAAGQLDVYMYLFNWSSSVMPEAGAAHSMDIPFWFGNTSKMPVTAADSSSADLERQMTNSLVSFAHRGKPNHPALPEWAAYEPGRRATMIFGHPSRSEDDPDGENREAWNGVPDSRLGV